MTRMPNPRHLNSHGLLKPLLILLVLWLLGRFTSNSGILLLLAALVVWKLCAVVRRRLQRLARGRHSDTNAH